MVLQRKAYVRSGYIIPSGGCGNVWLGSDGGHRVCVRIHQHLFVVRLAPRCCQPRLLLSLLLRLLVMVVVVQFRVNRQSRSAEDTR